MIFKRTEVAEILGVSARTLQRIINRENLPIRKKTRLTRRDVERIDQVLKTTVSRFIR
jgi:plasmid maintenance system antidote protein VapI